MKEQMLQITWQQGDCAGAKWATRLWMLPGTPFKERGGSPQCLWFHLGFCNFADVTWKICEAQFPAGKYSSRQKKSQNSRVNGTSLYQDHGSCLKYSLVLLTKGKHTDWEEEPITIFYVIISFTAGKYNRLRTVQANSIWFRPLHEVLLSVLSMW